MKISILGATGVVGRHVLPRLLERGHEVTAVVRRKEQAHRLQHIGVRSVVGDILDHDSLQAAMAGQDCVLHLATAIPVDRRGGDWTANDRIRREGTRTLIRSATVGGARRYIQQSIIMLYGDCAGETIDESAPLNPPPGIRSAFDMEQQVRASGLEWCILRGAHFYGQSTGTEDQWRDAARSGRLRIPGDGKALISLIHVIDMARAIVLAAETARAGSIYNVADDRPVAVRELFTYVARTVEAPDPEAGGEPVPSLGCGNARIKADLGWHPAFPTYYSGLQN